MRISIATKTDVKRLGIDFITLEKDGEEFSISCNGESILQDGDVYWKGVDIDFAYGDEEPIDANGKIDILKDAKVVDMQAYDYDKDEELFNLIPIMSIGIYDEKEDYIFPKKLIEEYNKAIA